MIDSQDDERIKRGLAPMFDARRRELGITADAHDAPAPPGEVSPDVALVEAYGAARRDLASFDTTDCDEDALARVTERCATAKSALLARLASPREVAETGAPIAGGERGPVEGWRPMREVGADGDVVLDAGPYTAGCTIVGAWNVMERAKDVDGRDCVLVVAQGRAGGVKRRGQLAAEDALAEMAEAVLAVVRPGKAGR